MHYDFDTFLNEIKYLDLKDIMDASMKKHKQLDKVSTIDKKEGAAFLQNKISGLLYFLEMNMQSPLLNDDEFIKLKPICESLISKKQLDPQTISLFK
jgi:hypothetical protein